MSTTSDPAAAPAPAPEAPKLPPGWVEGVDVKQYKGACHCHKFEYEFECPDLENEKIQAYHCNCSLCSQRGYLLV